MTPCSIVSVNGVDKRFSFEKNIMHTLTCSRLVLKLNLGVASTRTAQKKLLNNPSE